MAVPETLPVHSAGGVTLAGYRWTPTGEPRAVAVLVHGVGEHARRYQPVADALTAAGYVVYGYDGRGHGASLPDGATPGEIGADGWTELVADIGRVATVSRSTHEGLPLALVTHSLGSFAAQQWLPAHSSDVDAVVLSGTTALDLLEPAMNLDEPMALDAFNVPFQPARTDFDWLSRDEAEVDTYIADPDCGFGLDVGGTRAVFEGARPLADPAYVGRIRADLPLYVVVGDQDPLNGQLALVHALVERFRTAGLTDVTLQAWPGARHEVFNETNRAEVLKAMTTWLDAALTR